MPDITDQNVSQVEDEGEHASSLAEERLPSIEAAPLLERIDEVLSTFKSRGEEMAAHMVGKSRAEFDKLFSGCVEAWKLVFETDMEHAGLLNRPSWGSLSHALVDAHIGEMCDELMDRSRFAVSIQAKTSSFIRSYVEFLLKNAQKQENDTGEPTAEQRARWMALSKEIAEKWASFEREVATERRLFRTERNQAENGLVARLGEHLDFAPLRKELKESTPTGDALLEHAGILAADRGSAAEKSLFPSLRATSLGGTQGDSTAAVIAARRSSVMEFERGIEDRFFEIDRIFNIEPAQLSSLKYALELGVLGVRTVLLRDQDGRELVEPMKAAFLSACQNVVSSFDTESECYRAVTGLLAIQARAFGIV